MTNFTFEVVGHNRVANVLRAMAAKLPKLTQDVSYVWAQNTRRILKSTPYPRRNTAKMRWKSDRQRRYVMAAIRRGDISVPYVRTGNLANRWRAARTQSGALITNSASYAHWVVGNSRGAGQYWMHDNRWWLARPIILAEAPKLVKMLTVEIRRVWESGNA